MPALKEGDRISNYILQERVGAGSFGEVWRARHHVFSDVVAIKVPTDTEYVRNLQREGVVIHGVRHPNIVRAIDMDPYAEQPYLVMEFVDGPSLRQVIDHHGRELPILSAVAIVRGLLQALAASHDAGLVHRDIKPANILIAHPLEEMQTVTDRAVKVADFGLGKIGGVTAQSIMQSGSLLTEDGKSISGTLAYMAPEVKEGHDADGRSDLYSCGIVLFEMLTGERPQGGEVPSSLRPDVPKSLDAVFQRCYTRADRRYDSAREMLSDLNRHLPPRPPRAGVAPAPSGIGCPSCDRSVQRDDQFCISCGRQLTERVARCSSCQGYPDPNDRYCIFCGQDLRILAE